MEARTVQSGAGLVAPRTRARLLVLATSMLVWAVGYTVILIAQGSSLGWQRPAGLIAMALIPAGAVALGVIGRSPRQLVGATTLLAAWATILGLLGLLSLGLPLIFVAALAYRVASNYADGKEGRPNREWVRWAVASSAVLGVAVAAVLLTSEARRALGLGR